MPVPDPGLSFGLCICTHAHGALGLALESVPTTESYGMVSLGPCPAGLMLEQGQICLPNLLVSLP